jgi:HK97 gp10 family phage protein
MADTEITGMDDFFKNLDKMIIPKEKRVKAVNAAADVFVEHLKPNIPNNPNKKTGKHLRDTVTYKPNQYPDGSTDVGFTEDGYYGRFQNNGTKKITGMHFMEHSFDQADDDMKRAMYDVLKE